MPNRCLPFRKPLYLKGIFTRWDWGISDKLYLGQSVGPLFISKLPATMLVNLYSIIFSIPIGIILGVFAALKKNTWAGTNLFNAYLTIASSSPTAPKKAFQKKTPP